MTLLSSIHDSEVEPLFYWFWREGGHEDDEVDYLKLKDKQSIKETEMKVWCYIDF